MKGVFKLAISIFASLFLMGNLFAQTNTCEAFFNITSTSGLTVHFNNESVYLNNPGGTLPPTLWDFADGTSSDDYDVTHTFQSPGTYQVCVTAFDNGAVCDSYCESISVGFPDVTCDTYITEYVLTSAGVTASIFNPTDFGPYEPDNVSWFVLAGGSSTFIGNSASITVPPNLGSTFQLCVEYSVNGVQCNEICETITIGSNPNCFIDFAVDPMMGNDYAFAVIPHPSNDVDYHNINWSISSPDGTVHSDTGEFIDYTFPGPGSYLVCVLADLAGPNGNILCSADECHIVQVAPNPNCNYNVVLTSDPSNNVITMTLVGNNPLDPLPNQIEWILEGGGGVIGNGPSLTYTVPGPGLYEFCAVYEATGTTCGGVSCASIEITDPNVPSCNFVLEHDVLGLTGIFFANNSSTTPFSNVSWEVEGNGFVISGTGTPFTVLFPSPGHYTVCALVDIVDPVTGAILCSEEQCENIFVAGNTNCNINFSHDLTANGNYVFEIIQNPLNEISYLNVQWFVENDNGIVGAGTGNPFTFDFPGPGVYEVCVLADLVTQDGNILCSATECHIITVGPDPCPYNYQVQLTNTDNVVNMVLTSLDPNAPVPDHIDWVLEGGGGFIGSGQSLVYTVPGGGNYLFCAEWEIPGTGCFGVVCEDITISGPLECDNVGIFLDWQGGLTYNLFADGTGGTNANAEWTISNDNGFSVVLSGNPATYDFPNEGFYQICLDLEIVGPNGNVICTYEECIIVDIHDPTTNCQYDVILSHNGPTVTMTLNGVGMNAPPDNIDWILEGGGGLIGSGPTVTFTVPGPGLYEFCAVYSNADGSCSGVSCATIQIGNPGPDCNMHIEYDLNGFTGVFEAFNTSNLPFTNVEWEIAAFGVLFTGSGSPFTFDFPNAGTYHVCATGEIVNPLTGDVVCVDQQCITVHVFPTQPCDIDFGFDLTASGAYVFEVNADPNQGFTYTNIEWTITDNSGSEVIGAGSPFSYNFPNAGLYQVCVIADVIGPMGDLICVAEECHFLQVGDPPNECDNTEFEYTLNGLSGVFELPQLPNIFDWVNEVWLVTDAVTTLTFSGNPVNITFPGPGTYMVCVNADLVDISGTLICTLDYCESVVVEDTGDVCEAFFDGEEWLDSPIIAPNQAIFHNLSSGPYTSVLWNFGDGNVSDSHTNPLVHTYDNPGVYNVCLTVSNPNSPNTCNDTYCELVFISGVNPCNFNLDVEVDGFIVEASVSNANGSTPTTVEWYLDPNTTIGTGPFLVYTFTDAGVYTLCADFEIPGTTCSGTLCEQITISDDDCQVTDCVFPGDANYDQIANNFDILPLGLGFGTQGPLRPNASNDWYGQPAPDWQEIFQGGVNFKHSDCNGNGHIGFGDIIPIIQNYDRTHNGVEPTNFNNNPPIYIDFEIDTIYIDANSPSIEITADILVGTMQLPAEDIYGIAFTINYPSDLVEESSVTAMYTGDEWFGDPAEVLQLEMILADEGRVDFGYSRSDLINVSGWGDIATTSYVITDNLIGFMPQEEYQFTISITDIRVISNSGEVKPFDGISNTMIIIVDDETTGTENPLYNSFNVYPNPTNSYMNIEFTEASGETFKVYNSLGQSVITGKLEEVDTRVDVSSLTSGIYFINILTENGQVTKRILVE